MDYLDSENLVFLLSEPGNKVMTAFFHEFKINDLNTIEHGSDD